MYKYGRGPHNTAWLAAGWRPMFQGPLSEIVPRYCAVLFEICVSAIGHVLIYRVTIKEIDTFNVI